MPRSSALVDADQHDRADRRRCRARQSAAGRRGCARQHVRRAAAARGRSRGCDWPGAGTGAPRRASMPRWRSWTWPAVQASVDRAVERRRVAVLVGEVERVPRATAPTSVENATRTRAARGEAHPAAQAEDRVEHRAGGVRQRPAVDHRHRRADAAPAAEEPRAVGLELRRSPTGRRAVRPRRDVGRPDRRLARRRAAGAWRAARSRPGTHSVSTNSLEKAGWAGRRPAGASTISA